MNKEKKEQVFDSMEDAQEHFNSLKAKAKVLIVKLMGTEKNLAFYDPNITLQQKEKFDVENLGAAESSTFTQKPKEKKGVEFSRRWQIEKFWEQQPFYYDSSKMFWLWNKEDKKWALSDEEDFLNSIQETLGVETIDSKTRTELISGFKQIGRKHEPKLTPKSWIQFKDKIYDLENDKEFKATSEYFIKNPIPWKVGESEETPTIDKLFEEWVGVDYLKALNQLSAYSITPDRFMQRIIALVGGGNNGKGTYMKFLQKFLGKENCVSSELKILSESQFETAILYGKLLVTFGEVSYDDLKNTNIIKQIAGEDDLRYCFKGKTPFSDMNSALGICLTNSLPITPDKTMGFYRKWMIIDFPKQFSGIKQDLIGIIPEKEFENFSLKCIRLLKELYQNPKFEKEGDFQERMNRYEERSNPVMKFVDKSCEESVGELTPIREFTNACNNFLRQKHLRVMTAIQIGRLLRNEGFIVGSRKIGEDSAVVITNLKVKDIELPLLPFKPSKSQIETHVESSGEMNGSNGSNGNLTNLKGEGKKDVFALKNYYKHL